MRVNASSAAQALAIFLSVVASGFVNAIDATTAKLPHVVVDRQLSIGDKTLHLPSGDWTLTSRAASQVTQIHLQIRGSDVTRIYALRTNKKMWAGSIFLQMPISSTSANKWVQEPCKEEKYLFKDDFNSGFNLPECLLVRKLRSHLNNPTGDVYRDAVLWFRQAGIALPKGEVYEVAYMRYASNHYGVLRVFLPASQVIGDEAVIAWAQNLPDKFRLMFADRQSDASLPELPTLE